MAYIHGKFRFTLTILIPMVLKKLLINEFYQDTQIQKIVNTLIRMIRCWMFNMNTYQPLIPLILKNSFRNITINKQSNSY